jgi:hypothetical protein
MKTAQKEAADVVVAVVVNLAKNIKIELQKGL